jgi:HK97 gp10 family phage protein
MGLRCQIDVIDDLGYPDVTPTLGLPIDYSDGLDIFCDIFQNSAEDNVPVDTGNLLSSISSDNDGYSMIECEASADYAQYVEFGTWKMSAQPYFIPALEEAFNMAKLDFQDAIDEAMEEEAEMLEEMEAEAESEEEVGMGGGFFGGLLGMILVGIFIGMVKGFFELLDDDSSNISISQKALGEAASGGSMGSFVEVT